MPQQTFTSTRPTRPDPPSLRDAVRAALADATVVGIDADPYTLTKDTPWTGADLAAAQTAIDAAPALTPQLRYSRTSREKDLLATIALIKRAQGIAAWNAMTVPQKVAAATAEADVWVTIRDFIETNL